MKFVAVAVLGCALSSSNQAFAERPLKSRGAESEQLLRQAQTLLDEGRVEAACAKFEAAEAHQNGAGTLLRLGDCYERAGRTASAWHTFLEAEALAQSKKELELSQLAAERVTNLEPKLVRIVFVVPTTSRVPGLAVRLGENAVPPSSWGTPIPVDPGPQRVSATAKGYRAWRIDWDASRDVGRRYTVNVPALAPEASGRAGSERGHAYRTAGIVTGSVGLAGLGAGAVFSAMSHNSETGACAKSTTQCAQNPSSKSSLSDAATLSFALGGALIATGVTLFVVAPSADHREQHAVRVAARYASGGGRVQLEGVW